MERHRAKDRGRGWICLSVAPSVSFYNLKIDERRRDKKNYMKDRKVGHLVSDIC